MSIFINHRRCPTCGHHIKHYYWYCGNCGNQDLTNWALTLAMIMVFVLILCIGAMFVHSSLCGSVITATIVNQNLPSFMSCQ